MMKRMFCLLLTVLMGVSCIFASAEDAQDNSADALTLAELQAFAARMQTLAMASTPLNDPADAKTEDGYAFEYSFGTIYADSPAMSIDTQLLSIVLTSAEEQGPRDIQGATNCPSCWKRITARIRLCAAAANPPCCMCWTCCRKA